MPSSYYNANVHQELLKTAEQTTEQTNAARLTTTRSSGLSRNFFVRMGCLLSYFQTHIEEEDSGSRLDREDRDRPPPVPPKDRYPTSRHAPEIIVRVHVLWRFVKDAHNEM